MQFDETHSGFSLQKGRIRRQSECAPSFLPSTDSVACEPTNCLQAAPPSTAHLYRVSMISFSCNFFRLHSATRRPFSDSSKCKHISFPRYIKAALSTSTTSQRSRSNVVRLFYMFTRGSFSQKFQLAVDDMLRAWRESDERLHSWVVRQFVLNQLGGKFEPFAMQLIHALFGTSFWNLNTALARDCTIFILCVCATTNCPTASSAYEAIVIIFWQEHVPCALTVSGGLVRYVTWVQAGVKQSIF